MLSSQEAFAYAVWVESRLYLFFQFFTFNLPLSQILFYFISVLQVITDDRINVFQIECRILLNDLFRRCAFVESEDDRIKRDARACNAQDACLILGERNCSRGLAH